MKKNHLVVLFFISSFGLLSQNSQVMEKDSYEKAWLQVVEFERKSLPRSAMELVDSILHEAIREKNSPQLIKALIHQGKYNMAIDTHDDTTLFSNLSEMLYNSGDVVEQAVIHSMLGELYFRYYQRDQWTINQRTELRDFVPSDMQEWTRNIFYDKVVGHLNHSIEAQRELEEVQVERYALLVEAGKDSRRFFPTLYDFLSRRAIEIFRQLDSDEDLGKVLARKDILPESLFAQAAEYQHIKLSPLPSEYPLWLFETYRKLLTSLLERDKMEAVLLIELDKLEDLAVLQHAYSMHAQSSYEGLLKKWEDEPISVEIILKMANLYQQQVYSIPPGNPAGKKEKMSELYELLKNTLQEFPGYGRISAIENKLLQITYPQLNILGNRAFSLKGEKELQLSYKNIHSLTATLYQVDSPLDVQMAMSGIGFDIENRRRFIKNIPIALHDTPPYLENETTFTIDVEAPGNYMLTFNSNPGIEEARGSSYFFSLSDMAVFARSPEKDKYDFFVVDRVTGQPVNGAKVNIYKLPGNWRNSTLTLVESVATAKDGLATYRKDIPNNDVFYNVSNGKEGGSLLSRLPFAHYSLPEREELEQDQASIFTDRSLYRPGQVVYFKAILTRAIQDTGSIVAGKEVEVILKDANGREASKQLLRTNEFGSVSGEFVLPSGTLPGNFILETVRGSTTFKVEEYKRPTFEVAFDKIEGTYRFGEEITLKGKAESFSGLKLQNSNVSWRITRQKAWWMTWGGVPEHFAEGDIMTGDKGEFTITFTPEKPDHSRLSRTVYSFLVEATVTDLNGETQVGSYRVPVGDVSMILQAELPANFEKESDKKIMVSAKNLDGADIEAEGSYQIFSLQENDSIDRLVLEGRFITGEQHMIKRELRKMRSGKYRLKLYSTDDRAKPVEAENDFILFSYEDKRPPVKTNEWFIVKNALLSPGEDGEVILGVFEKIYLLYELWQESTLLERKWIELDNENRHFIFPFKEEYKNGVTLMLSYVKDEKLYTHKTELHPKKERKELSVKLDVFRDKIRPGSDEEWRISVTHEDGTPVPAELLASMYDFSLDGIYPSHPWSLSLYPNNRYYSMNTLVGDQSFLKQFARGYFSLPMQKGEPLEFDRFNWYGLNFYHGRMMLRGGTSRTGLEDNVVVGFGKPQVEAQFQEAASLSPSAADSDQLQKSSLQEELLELDISMQHETSRQHETSQIRRNFNETAFFYPQLRTNDKGEVQVAFKVPESNTRWRFRVLVHDRLLNTGYAEAFSVSQKELMVTPNLPRFLRQGDKTTLSTKISNLSDSLSLGDVRLELFNPATSELLENTTFINPVQGFSIDPGGSSEAAWSFEVPAGHDIIGVRIIARNEHFSDGEQHLLAVLPNRMLVTESMRMDLAGEGIKKFRMDHLLGSNSIDSRSDSKENWRLTLEFTSNPAWYAIQALPVLAQPSSENAVSWFASYYANSLGAYIGIAYPEVAAMAQAWKRLQGSGEGLLSGLEKNEELKNILLDATPWVMDAKNETEQKERLLQLFDQNRSRNLTLSALDKLQELQGGQGGWSWFKGFRPSLSITQYILHGFNRLQELGVENYPEEVISMQRRAVAYIDAEAMRRFEALKRNNKNWGSIQSISSTELEYLFVRSAYTHFPVDKEVEEMSRFYHTIIEKHWTSYGLYERALIVLLLQKIGKPKVVGEILASLREHAVVSEEMGMYWPNNRSKVFMSQSAISVQAFIIDAFRSAGAPVGEIDNMKLWLLKQKQAQQWEQAHATMDAVYTLLSTGSDWLTTGEYKRQTLGSELVEPVRSEPGTGYVKESWSHAEITPGMGDVTVDHRGSTTAWGALYWQYFEDIDKISKADGSLHVEKMLFTEQTDASGTHLTRVGEDAPLKVGDKVVVRLTLRSDRDIDFVHLKDTRAACFEPAGQLSGKRWQDDILFYQASGDASTNFYFDHLPRGTYIIEYPVLVNREGSYSGGIASVQGMYAPEFTSHTEGRRVVVDGWAD